MTDIIDIKALEPLGIDYRFWAIIGAILLTALLIAGVMIYRRRKKCPPKEVIVKRPAHEVALEGFYRLQNSKCFGPEEIKKLYFELSELFRCYLEERYNFPASDWTSQEIISYFNKNPDWPFELKGQSELFLSSTDLVKFAEFIPEEKQIQAEIQRAIQFVEATREVAQDEKL